MSQPNDKKTGFTGCCGWDFKGPMGSAKEMSGMMEKFCGEGGSFDCSKMMEMFKDEDGSFDVSKMMEMLTRQQVKSNKWKVESGKARDPELKIREQHKRRNLK